MNTIPQHKIDTIKAKHAQGIDEEIKAIKAEYEAKLDHCRNDLSAAMNEEIKEIIGSLHNDAQREIRELKASNCME